MYVKILELWRNGYNIRKISKELHISPQTVKRHLASIDIFTPRGEQVMKLIETGHSIDQVAEMLLISPKTVRIYLPYRRGPYVGSKKSQNAIKIAQWRQSKIK